VFPLTLPDAFKTLFLWPFFVPKLRTIDSFFATFIWSACSTSDPVEPSVPVQEVNSENMAFEFPSDRKSPWMLTGQFGEAGLRTATRGLSLCHADAL
jgi:hypothetical protein